MVSVVIRALSEEAPECALATELGDRPGGGAGQPAFRIIERSVASQGWTCAVAVGGVVAKKRANGMRVRRGWEVSMGALLLKLLWMMHGCLLVARNDILRCSGKHGVANDQIASIR